jgi:hypothetical protein
MIGEWIAWTAIAMPLNAPLFDETAAVRIDPLLVGIATKQMLGELGFGQARLARNK